MSRIIDADELERRMYEEAFEKDSEDQRWDSGCWLRYRLFEKILNEQPTIEPERTVKWIAYYHGDNNFSYACGYCGYSAPYQIIRGKAVQKEWNYCPNCGAKMEV